MIIETAAIGLTAWLAWRHGRDTYERIFHPVKFTPGRYRRALRRMCERRYRRGASVRQQVRALECLAWDMREQAGLHNDKPRPFSVPQMMYSIPLLRTRPLNRPPDFYSVGLASLIKR